jgi:hypothetical protein
MSVPGTLRGLTLRGGMRMGPQDCSRLQPDSSDGRMLEMSFFFVRAMSICSFPKVSWLRRLLSVDGLFAI